MVNYQLKFVKTITSVALSTAVLTGSVFAITETAEAAKSIEVKVSNGKLVYKKSNKIVKGMIIYNGKVYYNGKLLTGLKKGIYYVKGKKATVVYKGTFYKNGVKGDGWYGNGINRKWYEKGKALTGLGKNTERYFVNGVLNVGLDLFNSKLYNGPTENKELILFEGRLFNGPIENTVLVLYNGKLYNGSVENRELVLYEGKLYKGTLLNTTVVKYGDKWYKGSDLATGTITTPDGHTISVENGVLKPPANTGGGSYTSSDSQKVAEAKSALSIGDTSAVIGNLTLPTVQDNATITWTSSNTDVIDGTGKVVRPKHGMIDAALRLTATITVGSATDTKDFTVVVKAITQQEWHLEQKENLINAIARANQSYTNAIEGTAVGQYQADDRAKFSNAVVTAQIVLTNASNKTGAELIEAMRVLQQAQVDFENKRNAPKILPNTTNYYAEKEIEITFDANSDWTSKLVSISFSIDGGMSYTPLLMSQISVSPGKITLPKQMPVGSLILKFQANGYQDTFVSQVVLLSPTAEARIASKDENIVQVDESRKLIFVDSKATVGSIKDTLKALNNTTQSYKFVYSDGDDTKEYLDNTIIFPNHSSALHVTSEDNTTMEYYTILVNQKLN